MATGFGSLFGQIGKDILLGRSPGLVVMGGDSCSKGHGFESRHQILDGHFSQILVLNL